jgi:hypothetical protein
MATANMFVPVSEFRGVEVVPARGRTEMRLPGTRGSSDYDLIEDIREAPHSKGFEWLLEQWLNHAKEVLDEASNHNREVSGEWDLWLDQKEGLLPDKGPGMISQVGHNVTLEVYSSAHSQIDERVFGSGFFKYEPPGFDPTDKGRQIADALERIAKAQLNDPEFDDEVYDYVDADLTFGYALATCEYEKRYVPQIINGEYTERIDDRGTVFRNVMPYDFGFREWSQRDWQKQGGIVIQHEVSIPLILSEQIAAVVAQPQFDPMTGQLTGGAVYPVGTYFNLQKLWELLKKNTSYGQKIYPRDDTFAWEKSDEVETGIKQVLAYTVWSKDLDMGRLVREAVNRGASEQEIMLKTGITPDQVNHCNRWKLTAVDSTGGMSDGSVPDIIIQARANPYKHGLYPLVGCQCVPFPSRAMGVGYGKILYYLQLCMDTLLTLQLDNAIRDSTDMYLLMGEAIAGLSGGDALTIDQARIYEWDPNYVGTRDAKQVLQRFGPGAEARVAWPEGAAMLDTVYTIMQRVAGIQRPPFKGRQTATEIAQVVKDNMMAVTAIVSNELRKAFLKFARQITENNAQFMESETAIRLGGRAGLQHGFVQEAEQMTGSRISAYPVEVKTIGQKRMMDRVTQGQLLTQLSTTPIFQAHMQARMMGQRLPKDLENLMVAAFDLMGLDDVDRFLPQDDKLMTEQVVALLQQGIPVDLDMTRFRGPNEIIMEMASVKEIAEAGSYVAQDYLQRLQRRFREMLLQAAAAQQINNMMGGGQGQGSQSPMLPFGPQQAVGLPRGTMTEGQADIRNMVPTTGATLEMG